MKRIFFSKYVLFGCIGLGLSLVGWLGSVTAIDSPPTVDSVQLGLPISSINGEGTVDGSLFRGDFGEVTISVDTSNPTGYMSTWMQVNVSGTTASYYEWEIVGWQSQQTYGKFSYYDEVIDIDPELGSYRVKTAGNTIRYDSATNSLLTSNHIELIRVTAWTIDGSSSTANFQLTLSPTETSQLADLFFRAGFAPSAPNSTLLVQVSDIHIDPGNNYFPTPTIDDRLVNAINDLEFLPDELIVSGDIAISRSPSFGEPRTVTTTILAREELEAAMIELQRFDSRIRQWVITGNHDTDAHEIQPVLWSEVTGYPAFQRNDISGVPVFFLNGRHSGDLDAEQLAWLETEFTTIAGDQDIMVFVHQPTLGRVARERGVKRELVRMLAGRSGRVWVFSGHDHRFADTTYIENGTQFIQTIITTANSQVFNDRRNPGYGLVGLQNGRVVLRIFKDVKNPNYSLLPTVLPGTGEPFIWPYEDVEFPVLIRDEGTYSRSDYSFTVVSGDTGTWLPYVRNISWKLPLSSYDTNVNEVLILGIGSYSCEFSLDGTDGSWESAGVFNETKRVFKIPIPEKFIGTDVFFKATAVSESHFAGWGLSSILPPDNDNDGVSDAIDNCPAVANSEQEDGDADGVGNACDNCTLMANGDQRDTDGDAYGNICDADLDNNGAVNFVDLGIMKSVFFTDDANADFNGDGAVNFTDLGLLKSMIFQPPGPSGLAP